jgi:hypothetical protein
VGLFRRREPLHERLAREGGLGGTPASVDPRPAWQEIGVHGLHRPREWDVTVNADAPEVVGDAAGFVVLPDRTLLVEDGPDEGLEPLAAAVEKELTAPFRARATRQRDTLWAVQGRRIEVLALREGQEGDAIDVTHTAEGTSLTVDDARTFGSLPALEERGAREGREYTVHAERLDGDLWEIRAAAL